MNTRLKHISQEGHEVASDGRIYAYIHSPCAKIPFLVVQPEDARWGAWVRPMTAPPEIIAALRKLP